MRRSIASWAAWAHLVSLCGAVTDSYHGQYADDCPSFCSESGPSPANWTQIHHLKELKTCDQTVIFDVNVQTSVDDPENILTIRACVSTGQETYNTTSQPSPQDDDSRDEGLTISNSCGGKTIKTSVIPQVGGSVSHPGSNSKPSTEDILSATRQLISFMKSGSQCGTTILFAKSASAVVGLYSGAQVAKSSAATMLGSFNGQAQGGNNAFQVCSANNASLTFGVYAASLPDLGVAQDAVKSWTNGLCLNGSSPTAGMQMEVLVSTIGSNTTSLAHGNSTVGAKPRSLQARGNCRTEQVKDHDGCADLATRCGISGNDLTKYNSRSDFCSTLKPKQYYCCSAGDLPDMRPQPDADGTCHAYNVAAGDGCWAIANAFGISQDDIESFNKHTWAWAGCSRLQSGQRICLSKGNPPMPVEVPGTTCGPQVPGTKKPTDGTALADLNPCLLNACCDVWGFCGTTAEFCTPTPADTGAPGTARPGTNGCISNCGTSLVNNGRGPDSFMNLGYFEGFSHNRRCLYMDASRIPGDKYSHVHFAFATVTPNFGIDLSGVDWQFYRFLDRGGFKKILSFGGWDFSTGPETFQRFRQATTPANRGAFVNNLVNFLNQYNIDGFDFDWEYPGAPDIPDIPPGGRDEGDNYLGFLSLLRARLPSDKSISIALPSSFWYLRAYPVKEIAKYVNYFVYMTYDLHGQWDVDNKWAIPSCDGGNCLRSHVNKTETLNSLVMLTKAGIESRQIVVGISSYGRSFRMANENCAGPFCTFTGGKKDSHAYKGRCTETAGYISNAELNEIIQNHGNYSIVKSYTDDASNSNILMYGNPGAVDWVAYMDGNLKTDRINWIKSLNFGGFTDWAIDLEAFVAGDATGGGGGGGGGDDDDGDDYYDDENMDVSSQTCTSDRNPGSLEAIAAQTDQLSARCLSLYTLDVLQQMLDDSLSLFAVNSHGYDDKFGYYAEYIRDLVDPKLENYMRFGDGAGNKFFSCHWQRGSSHGTDPCTGLPHFWEQEETFSVEYELVDEQGFYDDLAATQGIDKAWVAWGERGKEYDCAASAEGNTMRPGGSGVGTPCRHIFRHMKNVPVKADDDKIIVANPKDWIDKAWNNITSLQLSLYASYATVGFGIYGDEVQNPGSELDAIVAYSMPVLQLAESIDSMKDIKQIGKQVAMEKKRELIFKILTYIFMALPFAGEALGPLVGSATALARIALLISEAGSAAITIADVIKDPTSAPFAMLGLILGAVGGGGGGRLSKTEGLGQASKARSLMKEADLAKFPQRFRDRDALIQKIFHKPTCKA